ncbi:hypothetical protein BpHYR1_037028 [Brachionus plicatilis]|uniref:Uncharacterized protein n=1 Tax=Brachionus plicatilis TaxID=10195 RepID=A0A3M7SMJ1_BRAPC|nr:hypothetical protein BpHYR1_037028 [Brachionus plicatilis]
MLKRSLDRDTFTEFTRSNLLRMLWTVSIRSDSVFLREASMSSFFFESFAMNSSWLTLSFDEWLVTDAVVVGVVLDSSHDVVSLFSVSSKQLSSLLQLLKALRELWVSLLVTVLSSLLESAAQSVFFSPLTNDLL